MLELFLFLALGFLFGVIAGLLPGIHPNLLALIFSSLLFSYFPNNECFLAFIVAMGVTNSFISAIPSILFGAPEEDTCLSILPGHYLLVKGYGYYAIKLILVGSLFGFILCLMLLPIVYIIFPLIYDFIRDFMGILLLFVVVFTIILEKTKEKMLIALFVFIFSGIIGIFGNNLPINSNFYLFVALTGLFGMPTIILAIRRKENLPEQKKREKYLSKNLVRKAVFLGSVAGLITGLLPGVGASQATLLANLGKSSPFSFLISLGSATTSNVFFSFLALWLIGKPRSGLAVAIKNAMDVEFKEFLLFLIVSLISASLSTFVGLQISKKFINLITKLDYKKLNISILLFLMIFVYFVAGYYGMFLLIITTSLGIFTILSRVRRVNLMGFLIFPTILFFMRIPI